MKTLLKVSLVFLILLIASSLGGHFYFDRKFSPPPNYLAVQGAADSIQLTWKKNELSPIAALLLPVSLEGIPEQFYMQFDLGSHSTLFYRAPMQSIHDRYPDRVGLPDSSSRTTGLSFNLGKLKLSSKSFKVLDYGSSLDWQDREAVKIIGTLGADLLEKKVAILNFKENYCFFGDSVPGKNSFTTTDLNFKRRRILIPATILGKNYELLYDTGTSAFDLVTSKAVWDKLRKPEAEVIQSEANSVGRMLTTYTAGTDAFIHFGPKEIPIEINEVTYISGTSFMQYWMMKLSGMGGMIGNKLFQNRVVLLDVQNRKFGLENVQD